MIRAHVANFRCEGWQTSDGDVMTVSLPAASNGHFGRNCAVSCLLNDRWTVPRLVTLLHSLGIFISKSQVGRLLIGSQDGFLAEVRDVLRAGLVSAAWITVDYTGARHKAANGFCTQIGNAHFAWFGTTSSKGRLNFLELLRVVLASAPVAFEGGQATPLCSLPAGEPHADGVGHPRRSSWNARRCR